MIAFSFTIVGHDLFEKIVNVDIVGSFLDGVTAAVVGFIAITAFQLMRDAVSIGNNIIIRIIILKEDPYRI